MMGRRKRSYSGATRSRAHRALERLEPRSLLAGDVVISEFLSLNTASIVDEDGDYSDWIEIYNNDSAPRDLGGWHLTNDASDPDRWTFPSGTTLAAGEHFVVFASGKNRTANAAALHTDFTLADAGGGYLGLVNASLQVAHEFAAIPEQAANVSYGLRTPTPSGNTLSTLAPTRDTWLRQSRTGNDNGNLTWENDAMWVARSGTSGIGAENRWSVAEWNLASLSTAEIVAAHMEFNPRTRADPNAVQESYRIADGIVALTYNQYVANKAATEAALGGLGRIAIPASGAALGQYIAGNAATAADLSLLTTLRDTTDTLTVSFKAAVGAMEWDDGANLGGPGYEADLPIRLVVEQRSPFTPSTLDLNSHWFFTTSSPRTSNAGGITTLSVGVYITEFLAINQIGAVDQDGDHSPWIELFNNDSVPRDLGGWRLTNSAANLAGWTLPAGTALGPGEFLRIFASGKNRTSGELHTDFTLSAAGGYLALVNPSLSVEHELIDLPPQIADVGYGLAMPDHAARLLTSLVPTRDTWVRESMPNTSYENDAIWVAARSIFGENRWGVAEWSLAGIDEVQRAYMEFNPKTRADAGAAQDAFSIASGIAGLTYNGYQSTKAATETTLAGLGRVSVPATGATLGAYLKGIDATAADLTLLNTLRATTGSLTVSFKSNAGAIEWDDGANAGGPGLNADLPIKLIVETEAPFVPFDLDRQTNRYFVAPRLGEYNGAGSVSVASGVYITEVVADNNSSLLDEDGESPDWIEIYNGTPGAIDLGGWRLADDPMDAIGWTFPAGTVLARGEFLTVFASGKDRRVPGSPLHTNFSLGKDGEFLGLYDQTGALVHAYNPVPNAREDVAYGIRFPTLPDGVSWAAGAPLDASAVGYIPDTTPGTPNTTGQLYDGFVADTHFNVDRGVFEQSEAFDLVISTATTGATIYYTTDGSVPGPVNPTALVFDPASPLHIDRTSTVRAAATRPNYVPTNVDTATYLFLDDVIAQSPTGAAPPGWPSGTVNGQVFNYGMDPNIVNDPIWGPQLKAALESLPSVSLVTDLDNLFDPNTGLYTHAGGEGEAWERPASIEMIFADGTAGFQVEAGVRPRGNFSASGANPKHSLRLFFREQYGDDKLRYPVFGNEGANEFDRLDLSTAQNDSWPFTASVENTFIHDFFAHDDQRAMGQPHTRGRYAHLYLNGVYWGLYMLQERADGNFGESYLGGDDENYDVIKSTGGPQYQTEITAGTIDAWQALWQDFESGVAADADYMRLQGLNLDGTRNPAYPVLLDVDNLVDYLLDIFYTGDEDRGLSLPLQNNRPNNFFAIRDRNGEHGFQFIAHDAEQSMLSLYNVGGVLTDRTGPFTGSNRHTFAYANPQWMHQSLMQNAQYRMAFADHVHELFFNGGVFTPEAATSRFLARASEIELAMIAESARWGDAHATRATNPLTQNDWRNAVNTMVSSFFPQRTSIVLDQLRNDQRESPSGTVPAPLYPSVAAPVFNQHGGTVAVGFQVTMSDPGAFTAVDTTLVASGQAAESFVPTDDSLGAAWTLPTMPGATAAAWNAGKLLGTTGVGYEAAPQETINFNGLIGTDVGPAMQGSRTSVYTRVVFDTSAGQSFDRLILKMKYDDAFVAYLDGVEVARSTTAPVGMLSFASAATGHHGDDNAIVFQEFDITAALTALGAGSHVLAIHGMNVTADSTDLLILPELVGRTVTAVPSSGVIYYTTDDSDPRRYDPLTGLTTVSPTAIDYAAAPPAPLAASTVVKARLLSGSVWSALNSALFSVRVPLSITEVMYNPAGDDATEFVEVTNTSDVALSLAGVRLALNGLGEGIEYEFRASDTTAILAPHGRVVIARDRDAYLAAYSNFPQQLLADRSYSGALANEGETLTLLDAAGGVIESFAYGDQGAPGWYSATDGGGNSLVRRDEADALADLNNPASWRASYVMGGSPGQIDPERIAADLDGDAVVGLADVAILQGHLGTASSASSLEGDLSGDGRVDRHDARLLAEEFGRTFVLPPPVAPASPMAASSVVILRRATTASTLATTTLRAARRNSHDASARAVDVVFSDVVPHDIEVNTVLTVKRRRR